MLLAIKYSIPCDQKRKRRGATYRQALASAVSNLQAQSGLERFRHKYSHLQKFVEMQKPIRLLDMSRAASGVLPGSFRRAWVKRGSAAPKGKGT